MNVKPIVERLNSTDRAVSPVIGVILMVAITVILAAVIGTFVLDLGQSTGNSAPSSSLSIEDASGDFGNAEDGDNLFVIRHQGGDTLNGANLQITVRNASDNAIQARWSEGSFDGAASAMAAGTSNEYNMTINGGELSSDTEFSTGDSVEIVYHNGSDDQWASQEYVIQIVDTESDSTVGSSTVELR